MKDLVLRKLKSSANYLKIFIKWLLISTIVGIVTGLVGTTFHKSVDYATEFRVENPWLILFLPFGGLLIVALYRLCKFSAGTNRVIEAVGTDKNVPFLMAPLIFVSTVITHLFGGSAGREGAAIQLGGSLGYNIGKVFRLDKKDMYVIVMIGMSGSFAALFGTPLTASIFALEVISVGVVYYVALLPCIISSVVAYNIAAICGVSPVKFDNIVMNYTDFSVFVKVIVLALLCALVSICFCTAIKYVSRFSEKKIPNSYIRAFAGGCIIILLTLVVRTTDYNGAGMDIISRAIGGIARPESFVLKIIFTVITIGAGFKGGEIVPTFFIGSTFGCVAGALLGLEPGFGAAIGFVALFCSVVNCPIASIILSVEVFGADSLLMFAIVCSVSYMMSGNYGLYTSQKIMYSKLKAEFIDIKTK